MIRNRFYEQVRAAELSGASTESLRELLGSRRSKRGIFEGDIEEGELEIGQVSAAVRKTQPAAEIVKEIWEGYAALKKRMCDGI